MILSPNKHLNFYINNYDRTCMAVDKLVLNYNTTTEKDWPKWCFLPDDDWFDFALLELDVAADPADLPFVKISKQDFKDAAYLSFIFAGMFSWRLSQGIYRYDPVFFDAIKTTVIHGEMPVDVLLRLPEWCVYVECPGQPWENSSVLNGFFAVLLYDGGNGTTQLCFILDKKGAAPGSLDSFALPLGGWTVTEAVDRLVSVMLEQSWLVPDPVITGDPFFNRSDFVENMAGLVHPLLSFLIYLCSDEPEITNRDFPGSVPSYTRPRNPKRNFVFVPPSKPKIWDVGQQIGKQLRDASADLPTGRTVTSHFRKAHWHGFWVGPMTGERKFRYKWLNPILVSGGKQE